MDENSLVLSIQGLEVGLGELCSKTLLCYAPMLSNALIMLSKNCFMLMVCSLYNIIHEHVACGGELHMSLNKRAVHAVVQRKIVLW